MRKSNSKQINIKLPKEDAELVKEVLKLEESNVEAHRLARKRQQKSEYEKRLEKLVKAFAVL